MKNKKKMVTKSCWILMFGFPNDKERFIVKLRIHDFPRTHPSTLNGKPYA